MHKKTRPSHCLSNVNEGHLEGGGAPPPPPPPPPLTHNASAFRFHGGGMFWPLLGGVSMCLQSNESNGIKVSRKVGVFGLIL